jgi:AraC-like DNA-binding protein
MLCSADGIGRPISEIAALAGFREMPNFTRMFKRRYGTTPGDVREVAGPGAAPSFES